MANRHMPSSQNGDLFDPDGEEFRKAVQLIIDRHAEHAPAADITAAISNFLVSTGLAAEEDLRREKDRIDLQSAQLIIETKRRIGTKPGFYPKREYVRQLDNYMLESAKEGKPRRLGILTDGRYWLLKLPNVEEVRTHPPYVFELRENRGGMLLYEWLRDELSIFEQERLQPTEEKVREKLGRGLWFDNDLEKLRQLYDQHKNDPSLHVKQELWKNLLAAALGEVVEENTNLEKLFLLHTYLSAVVGLAVQSAFGIDIRSEAASNTEALLGGQVLSATTGIRGVIESDFFAWPIEIEDGKDWIDGLATRVASFDWGAANYDFARVLYQAVIPDDDRRQLGEYYTPDWLAKAIVAEVVTKPLSSRVLDPSCGSGTFLRAAIQQYIEEAEANDWDSKKILNGLRQSIIGVDLHPVSVHLARATWISAARDVIIEAGLEQGELTIPVYLGDSLQLRTDNGNLLGETQVTIEVTSATGDKHRLLQFPRALVDQGDWFDNVMLSIASEIESSSKGQLALDEAGIPPGSERDILEETVKQMEELHEEGRNHIWAYYTRNLVRPIWLSTNEGKVDAIVGNPPWIKYSKTKAALREELRQQSSSQYRIWSGGRYAPHQDISGLFYARCVDLYLHNKGRIGMVMPHSALFAGHFTKWREGEWGDIGADMSNDYSWDLENIEPNTFFPVPACVVFATKTSTSTDAKKLKSKTKRWLGKEGGPYQYEYVELQDTSGEYVSEYGERAINGATIIPRVLFFVETSTLETSWVKGLCQVKPHRSPQEKLPWKNLEQAEIQKMSRPLEKNHIYDIHLGETVAPYILLAPLKVALPISEKGQSITLSNSETSIGGIDGKTLNERMRRRWLVMYNLWEEYKEEHNKFNLVDRIDYAKNLTVQTRKAAQIRLIYTSSGRPTAAVLDNPDPLIYNTLFWIECLSIEEADYLSAIINSETLEQAVKPLMTKGQFGPRHLQKHLWRLPIPEYDNTDPTHTELASLGGDLRIKAAEEWSVIRDSRIAKDKPVSVTVARRELRKWLTTTPEKLRVETLVHQLLEHRI